MSSNNPGGMADRIVGWVRGLFGGGSTAGRGEPRSTSATESDAASGVTGGLGDIGDRVSGTVDTAKDTVTSTVDDVTTDVRSRFQETAGEAAGSASQASAHVTDHVEDTGGEVTGIADEAPGTPSPAYGDVQPGVATDFGDVSEESFEHSDFDDAAGTYIEGDESYDTVSTDPDEAMRLHDAVGGRDEDADDTTDGIIDSTREPNDPARTHLDAATVEDVDVPGASAQDELTAFKGASSDEFATGGYATTPIDQADIEAASRGSQDTAPGDDASLSTSDELSADEGTWYEQSASFEAGGAAFGMSRERGTSGDGDQVEYTEGQRDNYALGDLGTTGDSGEGSAVTSEEIAAGTAEGTSPATGEGEDLSGAAAVIEAADAPDAGATDSVTVDEDFTAEDAAAGTMESSSDFASAGAVDAESASLSAQDELSVTSEERVTTFQSGTIAHEGMGLTEGAGMGEPVDSYADLPDTPAAVDADDTGRDDLSGDAYPSDLRADDSGSDAGWDAVTADVDDAGSSAGDLDTALSGEDLSGADSGSVDTLGAVGDLTVDQDLVATTDEQIGGEPSDLAGATELEADIETVETADVIAGAGDIDAGPIDTVSAFEPADVESSDELGGMGVSDGDATDELAGMGGSDGDVRDELGGIGDADVGTAAVVAAAAGSAASQGDDDVPAGAVRGDGTTSTPEGYPIKGNSSSMIYHLPHFPSYANTKAELCFATEDDAIAAGFRAPGRRNRGKAQPGDGGDGGDGGAPSPIGGTDPLVMTDPSADPAQAVAVDSASLQTDTLDTASDAGNPMDSGTADVSGDDLIAVDDGTTFDTGVSTAVADESTGVDTGEGVSDDGDIPAGAVRGDGTNVCPDGYPVKGNASSMIYHAPERASYGQTVPEFCFATEQDAENAGFRAPKR